MDSASKQTYEMKQRTNERILRQQPTTMATTTNDERRTTTTNTTMTNTTTQRQRTTQQPSLPPAASHNSQSHSAGRWALRASSPLTLSLSASAPQLIEGFELRKYVRSKRSKRSKSSKRSKRSFVLPFFVPSAVSLFRYCTAKYMEWWLGGPWLVYSLAEGRGGCGRPIRCSVGIKLRAWHDESNSTSCAEKWLQGRTSE